MDVEVLAVSEINSLISACPNLKAFITTNDKTPFTDGHIDLYTEARQRNADWRGRVSVQVKGRARRSARRPLRSHSIARADLLAYQKDSGVLYFVVTIDPETAQRTPYYALLSPFKIESIVSGASGDRRKVSVALAPLPTDAPSIERIVALALKTREQNVSLGFDPVLFEHAQSLTVHTASNLNFDAPITLAPATNDFALVLHTADGLSIPLGGELRIFPPDYLERSIDLQVRSGEVTYDGATVRRTGNESFEARVADGLTFSFRMAGGKQFTNVSLTLESTLADRLKALEFYVALLDTGVVEFNGNPAPFEITESDEDTWLRTHVETLRALAELFDHLGVDTHLIDLDQIEDEQIRHLRTLHRAFVQNEEIVDAAGTAARVVQRVGQWHLMFLVSPGSAPDKWRFVDPFSNEFRQQFRWSADGDDVREAIPVTAYDAVEDEFLGTTLNMRLGSIVSAYEAIAEFPTTYGLANQRMLDLIRAADATEVRRDELLDAATLLSDWLLAEQGQEPIYLVNRCQIAWRRGGLSSGQRSAIRELRRELARGAISNSDQLAVACALLLSDHEEVEDLLSQLSDERQLEMQEWPIWKLYAG